MGIFRDAVPRMDVSDNPSSNSENEYVMKASICMIPGKSKRWCCRTLRHSSHSFPFQNFPCITSSVLSMAHVEHIDFQKRFLKYPLSSVYEGSNKNRGQSFHWVSENSWVDWERGIHQSCSLDGQKFQCIMKEFSLSCIS